jgi:hypothetical protein
MKKIYEKNIELIKELYNSDFGENHRNEQFFKNLIEVIYTDPDLYDKNLKDRASKLTDRFSVEFGPDGICGWKILFDIYDGNASAEWLEKYKIIRQSEIGTLFWPCQKTGGETINVQRNRLFGDRIDLTLYDIKRYIEKKETLMSFENEDTKNFLEGYRKNGGFKRFVEDLNLKMFVDDKNYEVYDLSENNYKEKPSIDDEKCNKFEWSNRYKSEKKKTILNTYMKNILDLCKNNLTDSEI